MVLLTPNCSNTTSTEIMEEHSLCIKITNSVLCLTNSIYFCFTHWNTYYHIIHKLYRLEIVYLDTYLEIFRRMKFIKSYSVTFFTDFLRLQGFQSEESQGVNPPVQLCGGRG